jgi:hypothetical protein
MSTTEIEVRAIDQYGDAIDVSLHQTVKEARKWLPELKGETVAWVMERHTAFEWSSPRPDKYEMIDMAGDAEALEAGGWSKEVAS